MKNRLNNKTVPSQLEKEGFLYSFKEWGKFPVSAFFSNRKVNFKDKLNRDKLPPILGIKDANLIIPHQEHGKKTELVNNSNLKSAFSCDALTTCETGIALAVRTADCLSIFLYDPGRPAIAMVHAGWRSTKGGIIKNCILRMQEEFAVQPSHLKVAFGPGIRECCYGVKENLLDYFSKHIFKRDNCLFLNLLKANLEQLISLGVREENIVDSGICSSCQNRDFFSYRQEGEAVGRTISVIMLNVRRRSTRLDFGIFEKK